MLPPLADMNKTKIELFLSLYLKNITYDIRLIPLDHVTDFPSKAKFPGMRVPNSIFFSMRGYNIQHCICHYLYLWTRVEMFLREMLGQLDFLILGTPHVRGHKPCERRTTCITYVIAWVCYHLCRVNMTCYIHDSCSVFRAKSSHLY